jgi:prophage regulatory protein
MMIAVHHLVGAAEIGTMLKVGRQRVHQLTTRPDFPAPVVVLTMGKVWHAEEVRAWDEARKASRRPRQEVRQRRDGR